MNFGQRYKALAAATLSAATLLGCGSDASGSGGDADAPETGSLSVLLSTVPADAACLKVSFDGSRTVEKSFDLVTGSQPTLVMDRLPIGLAQVDAVAYASTCSRVTSSTVAAWVTEKPQTVRINPLEIARVLVKLFQNGRSEVKVDFETPAWLSESRTPIDLAIIGDTPYGAAQIDDFPNLLADIQSDSRISETVHVGDIKNGSSRCDDAYFDQILAGFQTMDVPLVYTPGDNEWTDCHRASNGAYDPVERLGVIRQKFFPVPGLALGGGFKQILSQSSISGFEKFVENTLWVEAGVAFGTVHVVGSNDSKLPWYTDDTTGTKVDDPARRDAERTERNAASIAWLDELFAVAKEQKAAGVVIAMQADMFDAFSVANNLPLDAFDDIVGEIAKLSAAFGKPVLLLEGDSHVYIQDNPLATGNAYHHVTTAVPKFTRIVVQGSTTTPLTEWLRLHVDASTSEVFTWERNAR